MNDENQFSNKDILATVRPSIHDRKIVDIEEEHIKFVIFNVGGNIYASYGSDVREILPDREIYPVPFLPDYLPGLINVRGDIESVIDICVFLGGKRASEGKVLDNIEDVVDMPPSSINPPLSTLCGIAKELISGTIEFSGTTVAILDIEKLAAKVVI